MLNELTDISRGDRRSGFYGHETRHIISVLNSYRDRCVPFCTTSAFPSVSAFANEDVFQLNQSTQAIDTVLIRHDVAHLAQNPVHGYPGDIDLLGQSQGRQTAFFVADNQIDGLAPLHQGQICGMNESLSWYRSLAKALIALIDFAGCYPLVLIVPTVRTMKTIGPALFYTASAYFSSAPNRSCHCSKFLVSIFTNVSPTIWIIEVRQ